MSSTKSFEASPTQVASTEVSVEEEISTQSSKKATSALASISSKPVPTQAITLVETSVAAPVQVVCLDSGVEGVTNNKLGSAYQESWSSSALPPDHSNSYVNSAVSSREQSAPLMS